VIFRSNPRGDRWVLAVPALPGQALRSAPPADAPTRVPAPAAERSVLLAIAVAGAPAVVIAGVVLLFARGGGSGTKDAAPPPVPTTPAVSVRAATVPASTGAGVPHAPLKPPSAFGGAARQPRQDPAHTAAVRLAAHLPVKLETTALLRVGSTVYAVGGTTKDGTTSDGIWELDPSTGRVRSVGHFIEPLTGAAAAVRGGVLYLAGGWTGEKLATGVLRWSPGQSSALVTRLPVALRDGEAAFVGGKLYVAGGSPKQVYEVDVDSGSLSVSATEPRQLRPRRSNLEYLTQSSRAGT
jgi:hypothetical protein